MAKKTKTAVKKASANSAKKSAKKTAAKKTTKKTPAKKPATKKKASSKPASKTVKARPSPLKRNADDVVLLSGGNPQIAKGYGDAPVQAYIAAMPDWKRELGRRIDAIVERVVPSVRKAVKWNSPFYGVEEGSWFLSFHVFAKYVKVTFFRGTSLRPPPAGTSKHATVRYYDIREGELDEAQLADWVKQASELPGEKL